MAVSVSWVLSLSLEQEPCSFGSLSLARNTYIYIYTYTYIYKYVYIIYIYQIYDNICIDIV